jgi:hypothetical protein
MMRGEDFINERELNLRNICNWLDIAYDEPALQAMLHPEDSPYASLGPLGAHLGNDLNFLESPKLRSTRIESPVLTIPLSWRTDNKPLQDRVIKLARDFGYN